MNLMRALYIIILEVIGIFLFSKIVDWSFIEVFFLSSLSIFGVSWLTTLNMNRNANMDHAVYKGMTGVETGEIRPFQINWNPFTFGTSILVVISLIISVIYYLPYFI
ncbi:hypothetical protein SAMN04488156_101686 [Bacillus sp. 166amftsu]|nr:hypothetical protein SAMN04488156_101686 [Bacillus sp. 166amftsu]